MVDVSVDLLVQDSGAVRVLQWPVEIEVYSNYITTYTFGDDILILPVSEPFGQINGSDLSDSKQASV